MIKKSIDILLLVEADGYKKLLDNYECKNQIAAKFIMS